MLSICLNIQKKNFQKAWKTTAKDHLKNIGEKMKCEK